MPKRTITIKKSIRRTKPYVSRLKQSHIDRFLGRAKQALKNYQDKYTEVKSMLEYQSELENLNEIFKIDNRVKELDYERLGVEKLTNLRLKRLEMLKIHQKLPDSVNLSNTTVNVTAEKALEVLNKAQILRLNQEDGENSGITQDKKDKDNANKDLQKKAS